MSGEWWCVYMVVWWCVYGVVVNIYGIVVSGEWWCVYME